MYHKCDEYGYGCTLHDNDDLCSGLLGSRLPCANELCIASHSACTVVGYWSVYCILHLSNLRTV